MPKDNGWKWWAGTLNGMSAAHRLWCAVVALFSVSIYDNCYLAHFVCEWDSLEVLVCIPAVHIWVLYRGAAAVMFTFIGWGVVTVHTYVGCWLLCWNLRCGTHVSVYCVRAVWCVAVICPWIVLTHNCVICTYCSINSVAILGGGALIQGLEWAGHV